MNGDNLTRYTAVVAVLAVAAVAALISYRHTVDVVTAHGEPGSIGRMYPAAIDGLIVAASMVLLDAARHRESAPSLAWWPLGDGIGATLAVNIYAGVPSGPIGAIAAAWPAAAFVGCCELVMILIRAAARRPSADTVSAPSGAVSPPVPDSAESAAMTALRATMAAGNPLSLNQLSARFNLSRAQATKVRAAVLAESNGRADGAEPSSPERSAIPTLAVVAPTARTSPIAWVRPWRRRRDVDAA